VAVYSNRGSISNALKNTTEKIKNLGSSQEEEQFENENADVISCLTVSPESSARMMDRVEANIKTQKDRNASRNASQLKEIEALKKELEVQLEEARAQEKTGNASVAGKIQAQKDLNASLKHEIEDKEKRIKNLREEAKNASFTDNLVEVLSVFV